MCYIYIVIIQSAIMRISTTCGYNFRLMFIIHAWISVYTSYIVVTCCWEKQTVKPAACEVMCDFHIRPTVCGLYFQSRGFASVVYKPLSIQTHTLALT